MKMNIQNIFIKKVKLRRNQKDQCDFEYRKSYQNTLYVIKGVLAWY